MGKSDEGHSNEGYEVRSSATGAAPPPPETFPASAEDEGPNSSAQFRQDIRDGMSEEEAMEAHEKRAADAEKAEKKKK